MWGQGDRVIIVLVSVLSGCIILYNIWESLIGVTILCLVVIYACISLLINDDLSTLTFTFQIFNRAGENIHNLARYIYNQASGSFHHSLEFVKTFYQEQILSRMNHNRRNTYQLSSESLMNSNRPSQLGFIGGSSPISKIKRLNDSKSENNSLSTKKNYRCLNNTRSLDEVRLSNRNSRNEDVNGDANSTRLSWKKRSSSCLSDDPFLRGESTMYSPEGSPWGTSISPKVKSRNQEVNIVQTVAGPLLSSTRFNIDPKVYSDVTSPGLTSRLTKYASEANNKLTHQSQYSIGQFPKVNLNCSPTPLINAKVGRMRTPVTVRIAPPETIKYSPPEKQKILSNICRVGSNQSPSVVQVLKEISLKRHASTDDMSLELIKKQKTDGIYSDEYENYDEITQKRTRDDSSRSDEEISVENTSRPYKKTKTPCYDVLSSLSCSPSTLSSGVKRKADISRSGTPELGKHFKSIDNNRSKSSPILSRTSGEFVRISKEICKNHSESDFSNSQIKEENKTSPKESLKSLSPKDLFGDKNKIIVENSPIKYTDRLFMKAEPQNIDKLKSLIEEHGNVAPKFSGDDGDEIKKSDVINMRQTSMKARLRSMFDAISGKSSNQIDPNVVIQAESVTPRSSLLNEPVSTPPNTTTSNLNTLPTTVNTPPISTPAVAPIIGKTKDSSTPVKHVTFQLSTQPNSIINLVSNAPTTITNISTPTSSKEVQMQKSEETKTSQAVANNSNLMSFFTPTNNKISPPAFSFASTTTNSPSNSTTSAGSVNNTLTLPSTLSMPSVTSTTQLTTVSDSTNIPKANNFKINISQPAKSESSSLGSFGSTSQPSAAISQSSGTFTFESKTNSPAVASTSSLSVTSPTPSKPQFQLNSSVTSVTHATPTNNILTSTNKPGLFSGGFSNPTTSISAVSSASTFSFGTSSTPTSIQSPKPPAPQAAFSFGSSKALSAEKNTSLGPNTTQTAGIKSPQLSSGGPSFSFNSNLNTAAPLFGVTTSSSAGSTTVSTVSSKSLTTSSSTSASKPVFSFGASSASTTSSAPLTFGTSSQPSSTWFGSTSATTSQPLQSTMSFVTTSSGTATTSTLSSTTASIFGSNNSQPSIFSSASNAPSTSTSAIPFGVPKTTESSSFGANAASTSKNIFNGINTAVTTSSSVFSGGSNIFGQAKAPAFNAQTTSTFGSTTTPTFGTSSTAFGTQPTPSPSFSTITPTTTSAPAFGTSSTTIVPSFGTSNVTPSPSFGAINTTVPSFGSTNTTTLTSPTTTTPSFGTTFSSTTVTSLFGTAQNTNSTTSTFNTTTPSFGTAQNTNSTTSTFNTTTPSFGTPSTAPPAFAPSTTAAPTFGTSTSSGFGGSNTAPSNPPMFGNSSSSFSGFGSNSTNTTPIFSSTTPASSTPAFGSPTTIPTFGASTSNNTGSTFAFGNTANQSQPQQSSVFNFGASGSSTSGGSGAAPFQFGASSSQAGGFNFSGGSQLSGSFNTSSQGSMFSIGSGSTAPKSRAQRSRRHQR